MNRIIYLLKNDTKEISMLFQSLKLLKQNFLPFNNYNVTIIHDEEISNDVFTELKQSGVDFENILISFEIPDYHNKTIGVPESIIVPGVDRGFGMGYRHMCRFYSYGMYELPELQNTKYYLRLDCDSYFVNSVNYDIFKLMEENSYIYGYNNVTTDNPIVCQDLWESSKEYSNNVKTLKVPIDQIKKYNIYYTNFEIAKFDWFSKSDYKNFFEHIDYLNGIYKYRWGDACIKYLGIEMFLDDSLKFNFNNIPYVHGNIFNIK